MVPRGNTKEEKTKERRMDGWMDGIKWSVTTHGLTEEDTGEKDMRRNLVLGEGNHSTVDSLWLNEN